MGCSVGDGVAVGGGVAVGVGLEVAVPVGLAVGEIAGVVREGEVRCAWIGSTVGAVKGELSGLQPARLDPTSNKNRPAKRMR